MMIQVKQTIIDTYSGDCFRACLASIFEKRLEEIPELINAEKDSRIEMSELFWERLEDYLVKLNYFYIEIPADDQSEWISTMPCYHIIRYIWNHDKIPPWSHAVVGKSLKAIWDPACHPLDYYNKIRDMEKRYGFFVSVEPSVT